MRRRTIAAAAALLGAASVVLSASVAPASPAHAVTYDRIAGGNRYETAVAISQQTPTSGSTVFLASGQRFPDALAAGPVAAAEDAHMLLTAPNDVPDAVMAELRRLAPSEVVLVGDERAISDAVRAEVANAITPQVTRIAGANRLQTSLRLLDRLRDGGNLRELWVVAGGKFPDALVAGSVAGRMGAGVLVDWHGPSSADIASWVEQARPYFNGIPVRIAGSTASVSAEVGDQVRRAGAASVTRYAGGNRYETARAIHDTFTASPLQSEMLVATGANFPDALAGSLLAAERGIPLYLTPSPCSTSVATMLRGERSERGIASVTGLGSSAALGERALRLEDCPAPPPPAPSQPPKPPTQPSQPPADVDCGDFRTQREAQAWFDRHYAQWGDIAKLDADGDRRACETLP